MTEEKYVSFSSVQAVPLAVSRAARSSGASILVHAVLLILSSPSVVANAK